MKQGWEIKKLGEVCTIERGGSPRPIQAYITESDDGINWIKIGDATDGSKYITSTKEKIKPEGMKKSRFVHKGDFILSNSMSFGRPYILAVDGCIHDGWLVIHDDGNRFDKNYLYYYLGSPNIYNEFKRLAVGGVVNNLNSELVRSVNVCIPPREEQERIVVELDCLSGVIEKKREQLRELDALAQSIFYQMFGDPITNEKGWEVKKLEEVCHKIGDGLHGTPKYDEDGGVAFINGNNLIDGKIVITDRTLFVNDIEAQKYRIDMDANTILLSINGTLGRTAIFRNENVILGKSACYCNINNTFLITKFVEHLMNSLSFKGFLEDNSSKSTIKNVGLKAIRGYGIILPPLTLQQEFADKIEAIEKQKELIKKSISETETLFNARMDYYFN
ncbi:MAG: restriction endonuclease subunit S [Alistipes sp.]|nr:restriction endonuclease subunit S [Alistipes sp.]